MYKHYKPNLSVLRSMHDLHLKPVWHRLMVQVMNSFAKLFQLLCQDPSIVYRDIDYPLDANSFVWPLQA